MASKCKKRELSSLPISQWGPRYWNFLHVLAINYTPNKKGNIKQRIQKFISSLPCIACQRHASTYILQHPPDISSSLSLQSWVYNFHNEVNKRLQKRIVPYEEYLCIYADELCWASWSRHEDL